MDWWRAYHGLPNDPKLALAAAVTTCNATRGEVLAVWVSLLDLASQNDTRGSIEGYDPEQIGWMLQMEPERVCSIIAALEKKHCIADNMLTSWEKRNPKREREDDSSERVKRYREKKRAECNAMKRPEERRGEESREEKTHKTSAPALASDVTVRERADRFHEFIAPWPRVANPDHAARAYLSCIETDADEARAFAARDRYLASDEVARGVITDPAKWLMYQKAAKWGGRWPKANGHRPKNSLGSLKADDIPKPTREQELDALRWIAENDPDPAVREDAKRRLA